MLCNTRNWSVYTSRFNPYYVWHISVLCYAVIFWTRNVPLMYVTDTCVCMYVYSVPLRLRNSQPTYNVHRMCGGACILGSYTRALPAIPLILQCMCTYNMYVHVNVYAYMYMHVHVRTCTCKCICVHVHACTCIYM